MSLKLLLYLQDFGESLFRNCCYLELPLTGKIECKFLFFSLIVRDDIFVMYDLAEVIYFAQVISKHDNEMVDS